MFEVEIELGWLGLVDYLADTYQYSVTRQIGCPKHAPIN